MVARAGTRPPAHARMRNHTMRMYGYGKQKCGWCATRGRAGTIYGGGGGCGRGDGRTQSAPAPSAIRVTSCHLPCTGGGMEGDAGAAGGDVDAITV